MSSILKTLRIKNLALVESLEWELNVGFTAVTGETGAGKSIILGALKLVLGERADRSVIRSGAEQCAVEALFQLDDSKSMDAALDEQGIDACQDGVLLVRRTVSSAGMNRQFVNGCATTLAALKGIGEALVDLHGPHDHQSLFSAQCQMDLLDGFSIAAPAMAEYSVAFRTLQRLDSEHSTLATGEMALQQEIDLLTHQAAEISNAALREDEEEPLVARHTVAANGRRLIELATQVGGRLEEAEDSVLVRLAECQRLLRELQRLDPALTVQAEAHATAVGILEEVARDLRSYIDRLNLDPAQLADMEERLNTIQGLKRKYGGSIAEIVAFGERAATRLRTIESRGAELERLEREISAARKNVNDCGARLGALRRKAAPKLAKLVRGHLLELGFKKAGFDVVLEPCESPRASGLERVDFLFAPNPGEPQQPLRAIASSGEISRVMLALKTALAAQDGVPVLVFDEIDANIGGEIAHAVGLKMKTLGERHQILCITHLPQVASLAANHFVVSKQVEHGRTRSHLDVVEGTARIEEVARMLGGRSDSALAHAETLLAQ